MGQAGNAVLSGNEPLPEFVETDPDGSDRSHPRDDDTVFFQYISLN